MLMLENPEMQFIFDEDTMLTEALAYDPDHEEERVAKIV